MQSQSDRCVQRRPLKRDGEEKAVRKARDGVIVALELVSGWILREKDCVVTSRTDRATVRRRKTTGSSQLITDMLIKSIKKEQDRRENLRKGRLRISNLNSISCIVIYIQRIRISMLQCLVILFDLFIWMRLKEAVQLWLRRKLDRNGTNKQTNEENLFNCRKKL